MPGTAPFVFLPPRAGPIIPGGPGAVAPTGPVTFRMPDVMPQVLSYSGGSLSLPDDRAIAWWNGPSAPTIDVAQRLRAALDEPVGMPALSRCVVPGDAVVIAVEPSMPEVRTVLASVVNVLEGAGVEREKITLLFTRK